jgi:hypothetical protein
MYVPRAQAASTEEPCTPGAWTLEGVPDPGGAVLTDIDAVSATDVWAVGYYNNPRYSPAEVDELVLHWDGTSWSQVPVVGDGTDASGGGDGQPVSPPYLNRLLAVTVVPGSPDAVWAVGDTEINGINRPQHLIEYSADGGLTWDWWSAAYGTLYDIEALAPNDIYAVGSNDGPRDYGGGVPAILHFNGSPDHGWYLEYIDWGTDDGTGPYNPVPYSTDSGVLYSIDASGPDDIWAVGRWWNGSQNGTLTDRITLVDPDVLEGRPSSGVIVPAASSIPSPSDGRLNDVSALSSSNAWSVGQDAAGSGVIERWSGTAWTIFSDGGKAGAYSTIEASSDEDLWMFDSTSALEHWDGISTSRFPVDQVQFTSSNSMSALASGEAWAAGKASDGPVVAHLCPIVVTDSGSATAASLSRVPAAGGPGAVTTLVSQGDPVSWKFDQSNSVSHSIRDASGMALFASGARAPGGSYTESFASAGRYPWHDPKSGLAGTVRVPITLSRSEGTSTVVRWSASPPPDGFVFDVQVKAPGSTRFESWKRGITTPRAAFSPTRRGTYYFRARLRRPSKLAESGWSPKAAFKSM